jgi:hypothetical protein
MRGARSSSADQFPQVLLCFGWQPDPCVVEKVSDPVFEPVSLALGALLPELRTRQNL